MKSKRLASAVMDINASGDVPIVNQERVGVDAKAGSITGDIKSTSGKKRSKAN